MSSRSGTDLPSSQPHLGVYSPKPATTTMGVDPGAIIPNHYGGRDDPYEVFKVIRAWDSGYFLGTALKYIRRAGKKDPAKHIEDLEKAIENIRGEIETVRQSQSS